MAEDIKNNIPEEEEETEGEHRQPIRGAHQDRPLHRFLSLQGQPNSIRKPLRLIPIHFCGDPVPLLPPLPRGFQTMGEGCNHQENERRTRPRIAYILRFAGGILPEVTTSQEKGGD